jgi:hypothetical protein
MIILRIVPLPPAPPMQAASKVDKILHGI